MSSSRRRSEQRAALHSALADDLCRTDATVHVFEDVVGRDVVATVREHVAGTKR